MFCRSENFVDFHSGFASVTRGMIQLYFEHFERFLTCWVWYFHFAGNVLNVASQLFGEQSVLFKEKINYKNPGENKLPFDTFYGSVYM